MAPPYASSGETLRSIPRRWRGYPSRIHPRTDVCGPSAKEGKVERRKARKAALEILYEIEITSEILEQALGMREQAGKKPLHKFSLRLLKGVEEHKTQIDRTISDYADNWSLERMPIIDRNILRICLYEMIYEGEIPFSVSINEAVELAKIYGTEESSKFVNGVLGKIASDLQSGLRKVEEMGR